jgi:hypothetical protein
MLEEQIFHEASNINGDGTTSVSTTITSDATFVARSNT